MKKLFYLFFLITIFALQAPAFAAENSAQKKSNFTPAQVKELEQVIHNYLIKNPQIMIEVGQKLQEQEQQKRKDQLEQTKTNIQKYKDQIFDTKAPGRLVLGNPKGKIIIAEFTQHQCHYCKETTAIIDKLLKKYPEIKLIVIYWPFSGSDAIYTAKTVMAAQIQGQAEILNQKLFEQDDFVNKDKADIIMLSIPNLDIKKLANDADDKKFGDGLKANFKLAQDIGLDGTPALIFTNDKMTKFNLIPGKTENFEEDIIKALNEVR